MSNYIDVKSNELKVTHEYSGKYHFYKVRSGNREHEVSIKIDCTCEYMSIQGVPNSKMCSHILAVLKHIVNKAEINENKRGINDELQKNEGITKPD